MPEEVMTVTCQVRICLPFLIIFTLIRRCVTSAVEISYHFRIIYKDGSEARPGVCNLTGNFNATKLLSPDHFSICFCDGRSSVSKKSYVGYFSLLLITTLPRSGQIPLSYINTDIYRTLII